MASQNYPPPSNSRSKTVDSGMAVSKDGHSVTKRLRQDLTTLMLSGDKSISAFPDNDNLFNWIATITGGTGTIYESQSYKLTMSFPGRYPYNPPVVKFLTPIFHPNVDEYGNICLDILKEKWSALFDVRTILLSIQSLLGEPNIESPLNSEAADLWERPEEYKKILQVKYREASKAT